MPGKIVKKGQCIAYEFISGSGYRGPSTKESLTPTLDRKRHASLHRNLPFKLDFFDIWKD